MTHLLTISMLLTLLAPQKQQLPDAFYELPEETREQATLIVAGTYAEGRSPCFWRPDGTRFWTMESVIQVTKVYRGEAGGKYIWLNRTTLLESKTLNVKLTRGKKYLVLLRPSERSMKAIQAGDYLPAWDALSDDEIIAIVELK